MRIIYLGLFCKLLIYLGLLCGPVVDLDTYIIMMYINTIVVSILYTAIMYINNFILICITLYNYCALLLA